MRKSMKRIIQNLITQNKGVLIIRPSACCVKITINDKLKIKSCNPNKSIITNPKV